MGLTRLRRYPVRLKLEPASITVSSPRLGEVPPEFSCDNEHINHWFRVHSRSEHDGYDCRVKYFYREEVRRELAGFCCISIRREPQSDFVGASFIADRFFDQDRITTVHLRWLAVKSGLERRGLGSIMMGSVVEAAYNVIVNAGAHAITVQHMGPASNALYRKFGFVEYGDNRENKLYLPAQAVLDTIGE
ncbi:GNAT family N-acetyltransferase [Methylobacterium sp. WL103]|nr:GNAT family N-acetyltransferase [Methylobacterium sp. WL103]